MSKRNRIKNNRSGNEKKTALSLSSYDPVTIEIPFIEVSEADIESQMKATAETFPDYAPVAGRAVKPDDHLLISLATTANGEVIGNLSFEKQRVSLSDQFIPNGLREGLLGMYAGESRTVEYEADSGNVDDGGDPVVVLVSSAVTLHEIQEAVVSEISDEWVERCIPGAHSVDEFKDRVRRQLEGKAHAYNEEMKYTQCAAALAQRLEGSIPDELFEQGIAAARQNFEDSLRQQGTTKEEFMRRKGIDENQLSVQFMMQGRQMIAEGMALEAMAEHLELRAEDDDIKAVFGDELTSMQVENMRQAYEHAGKAGELERMALCGKALEHVVAHARVSRKPLSGSMNPFGTITEN